MNRLKTALERLDGTIGQLETALDTRLIGMENALRETRAEADTLQSKNKNAQKVGERLDQVIGQLESILGQDNAGGR